MLTPWVKRVASLCCIHSYCIILESIDFNGLLMECTYIVIVTKYMYVFCPYVCILANPRIVNEWTNDYMNPHVDLYCVWCVLFKIENETCASHGLQTCMLVTPISFFHNFFCLQMEICIYILLKQNSTTVKPNYREIHIRRVVMINPCTIFFNWLIKMGHAYLDV